MCDIEEIGLPQTLPQTWGWSEGTVVCNNERRE